MKYFGTDGIRGIVGKDINSKLLKKIAKGLVIFFNKHKMKKVLLVGNDTRVSSDFILSNISNILLEYGIEIHNIGYISSPALAYITKKYHYSLSMMISASHNSHEYNGIKFFNSQGEKISSEWELEIESYLEKKISRKKSYSNIKNVNSLLDDYINYLHRIKRNELPCIFDCASGGASEIVKRVFPNHETINSTPNGYNINLNSGCTHIEALCVKCRQEHTIGFAFDGDADRVLMVDTNGNIISGDKLLFVLSKYYQQYGDALIGTLYTNEGLKISLKKRNISLIRTQVGDKNVYEKMIETGSILGGENSGHIILRHYLNTGDGVLNAIIIMNILAITKLNINELLNDYEEYTQVYTNLKLTSNIKINTQDIIDKYKTDSSRIVIRPSGTEPLLRIMVESKDINLAQEISEKIIQEIENNNY